MKTVQAKQEWLKKLLPEGFPYPSSTLISGPGGTGKPLVVFAFVSSWLKAGGSVIGIPLQYPTTDFVKVSMKKLYGMDVEKYRDRIVYLQFDPTVDAIEQSDKGTLKANLLKPEVWDRALDDASKMLESSDNGIMVFASALNLLLFSPTYKDEILRKINEIILNDRSKTFVFSVSTSAFKEDIKIWEESADNLMFTRMEKPMKLFFRIERMKDARFSDEEIMVPIPKEILEDIRETAEHTRSRIIPAVSKI
ncbi:MAG: hypothetical protein J7L32_04515 [Thermoplasmata archaeon]|nr:hypothetical protein [Thermoplasmata archaeon]